MTITTVQAERREKKLDMILEHFSIGDSVPRSPVELREWARKNVEKSRIRRDRREKAPKSCSSHGLVNRQGEAERGAG
ncbi:MAG: hypothetical protein JRD89_18340 [Deltaproteobacteria bacterium]|nr:hypothetical protein [Deltaproteobacteria bacterium]